MSKAITVALLLITFFTAAACSSPENNRETPPSAVLSADTIAVKPFLVDVRTREEFAAGSVKGAVNIPLDEVESRIEEFQGKEQIVVFCKSGNRSAQAIAILNEHGITNVTNGGSWQDVAEKYK